MERTSLRVIKTARTIEAMNEAVKEGFKVIVKKVVPSKEIGRTYHISRDKRTGEILDLNSLHRRGFLIRKNGPYETLFEVTHYPYHFENPYAAYLIPPDIRKGEKVLVEDLIEDVVECLGFQGAERLASCKAEWTGGELKILFDPDKHMTIVVG